MCGALLRHGGLCCAFCFFGVCFFFVINTWRKSRRWATIQSEGSARFIMLSSAFRSMKSCFLVPVKHCVLLISLTVWCAHPQWTTRSLGERLMLEFSALGLMFTAPSKVEWPTLCTTQVIRWLFKKVSKLIKIQTQSFLLMLADVTLFQAQAGCLWC